VTKVTTVICGPFGWYLALYLINLNFFIMARQSGIFKIEGTLDNVTFYRDGDSFRVRRKGGVSRQRVLNDPAFRRTRENIKEFANVSRCNALLRHSTAVLIRKAYDGKLLRRLMHVMNKVKNEDAVSVRGERSVYGGIGTVAGKSFLKGFDFNSRSHFRTVLQAPYVFDVATGKVTIVDLVPQEMLVYPINATHVTFMTAFLKLDFDTGATAISYSPEVNLPLDLTVSSPEIEPAGVPVGGGIQFFQFLIEFTQEVNGIQYPLNDGKFNVLYIMDVV
jgi:hypothetical protein